MLYNKDNSIKKDDPRKIISLIDRSGNHGKSSFFKYLLTENSDDIGRLDYGTAAQLRTRAMNTGPKKIYIIDLARTRSKGDSELDILSTIEDLKSGVVIGAFYGRGDQTHKRDKIVDELIRISSLINKDQQDFCLEVPEEILISR